MEILLHVVGFLCLAVGLAGAVLPLPGPPLSFIGILVLHTTEKVQFSDTFLWTWGLITVASVIFDYYAPIFTAKKLGGSKWGTWGATIGMLIGLFLGPLGLFIGAFIGALLGELLQGVTLEKATKVALGTFIGFAAGIILKLTICGYLLFEAISAYF
ncbi:MAG: DUF456 domain-containing protein [Spirosomataceae bacterium]